MLHSTYIFLTELTILSACFTRSLAVAGMVDSWRQINLLRQGHRMNYRCLIASMDPSLTGEMPLTDDSTCQKLSTPVIRLCVNTYRYLD